MIVTLQTYSPDILENVSSLHYISLKKKKKLCEIFLKQPRALCPGGMVGFA